MSLKKKNIPLGIAISAALASTLIAQENAPWIAAAEAAQVSTQESNQEQQLTDAFFNSKYTYDDAALLAKFWGNMDVFSAKLKIGDRVLKKGPLSIDQELNDARSVNLSSIEEQQKEQQSAAFFNSKYTYDDAALLAMFWGENSAYDAKLKIGGLLLENNQSGIDQALSNAREVEAREIDAFSNGKYTYDDAALLATFWGTGDVWGAKLEIGSYLLKNQEAALQQKLEYIRTLP